MVRRRLRDIIVVLPGITGSVLYRGRTPIWAPSYRVGASFLARPGQAGTQLELASPGDGTDDAAEVRATALMPDAHMVAGLVKIDGYSRLLKEIRENFEIIEGERNGSGNGKGKRKGQTPANLIEFAYDWRLDNRITAHRLADVVGPALEAWRRFADVPDARVIFIAHSMGGLVARYFLEVLRGWPLCRALITFGTPFRGSPLALGYVANGYKHLYVDLTAAMRSFPSVYQLLPIYPLLSVGGNWRRVAEVPGLPNIDAERAADALRFHREIESAVAANDSVQPGRYAVLPVVGTHQPTVQSARFAPGGIALCSTLPEGVEPFFGVGDIDGDGTVPVVSATPIDLSEVYTDVYRAERHSALQADPVVLRNLIGRIAKMQARSLGKLRGPEPQAAGDRTGLCLTLDDAYRAGEPVTVEVGWNGPGTSSASSAESVEIGAAVTHLANGITTTQAMTPTAGGWRLALPAPLPGLYRVVVEASGPGTSGTMPVHDLFEVVP